MPARKAEQLSDCRRSPKKRDSRRALLNVSTTKRKARNRLLKRAQTNCRSDPAVAASRQRTKTFRQCMRLPLQSPVRETSPCRRVVRGSAHKPAPCIAERSHSPQSLVSSPPQKGLAKLRRATT